MVEIENGLVFIENGLVFIENWLVFIDNCSSFSESTSSFAELNQIFGESFYFPSLCSKPETLFEVAFVSLVEITISGEIGRRAATSPEAILANARTDCES